MKNLINYLSKKSLSLGNGSGMTRKWFGNDSRMTRFSLASLICVLMLTFGVGNAWADYSITFKTDGTVGISSGGSYVSSAAEDGYLTSSSDGMQYGSGGQGGSYEMTMTSSGTYIGQIQATKISLSGLKKPSSKGGNLNFTITFTDESTYTNSVTTSTSESNPDISLTSYSSKTIQKIKFYSSAKEKRFYLKGFTVVAAAAVAVTGVTVSPTSKSIIVGQTFTITPTVAPAGATDKVVSWTSSATSKATVTSAGVVSGVAAGSSTITCTTHDGGYTATCATTVYGITLQAKADDGNGGLDDIGVGGPGAPTFTAATGTITAAANAGNYVFKEWQVTNATAASTTTSPTTISSPGGAVTVTAVYYKPISVSWMVAGSAWNDKGGTATVAYGTAWSSLTLPSDPGSTELTSCDADKFVGWTPAEISGKLDKDDDAAAISTLESNNLLNSGNKSSKTGKTITTATTFYAVFVDYVE